MQQPTQLETTLQTDILQSALSDEDVEILYDIVTQSGRLPDADQFTFRALFAAYEIVLTERGIDPDHDHVYFRFLLRLGGVTGHRSIYEKFVGLLDELGIQLEFRADEKAEKGQGRVLEVGALDPSENTSRLPLAAEDGLVQSTPKRRMSDSAYDLTTHGLVSAMRDRKGVQTMELGSRPQSAHGHRDLEHLRAQADRDFKAQHRKESLQREIDALRRARNAKRSQTSGVEPELPTGHRDELSRLYKIVVDERLQRLVGSLFDRWRVRFAVHQHKQRRLRHVADKIDRQVLLRQAWDRLRAKATPLEKDETLQQYALEEQRAQEARDRFLLSKAFTHWAKLTFDERHRTHEARNHVVKGRLFTAWRELTATNVENVRLFRLKRFFQRWQQHYANNVEHEYEATTHYEDTLRQRIYQEWFWSFCAGRAPVWRDGKLIVRYARRWLETCRALKERAKQAEEHDRRNLVKRLFRGWRDKLSAIAEADSVAQLRYSSRLQRGLLLEVKTEAVLAPAARAVSTAVDTRITQSALRTWHQRIIESQRAEVFAIHHLKQDGLSRLREGHAYHLVRCRVNERVANDALYKWILAERCALLRRHLERQTMGRIIAFFKFRVHEYNAQLEALRQRCVQSNQVRLRRVMFSAWRRRLSDIQKQQQQSHKFELEHTGLRSFKLVTAQYDHVVKLDEWATLSNYYLSCKKMLRRWRDATFEKQREKRRQGYLAVKRMLKINLASRLLNSWRERTAQIRDLETRAEELYEARLDSLKAQIFARMLTTLRDRQADGLRAEGVGHKSLLQSSFAILKEKHERIGHAERESDGIVSAKTIRLSSTILRKWSMKSLAIKGMEEPSILLKRRNEKAHFRAIFAHWRYQASSRWQQNQELGQESGDVPTSRAPDLFPSSIGSAGSSSAGEYLASMGFSASTYQDRDDWIPTSSRGPSTVTTVSTAPSTVTVSTFQPAAYLSTPSRRAARARAAVKLSSQTSAASRELIATLTQSQDHPAANSAPSAPPPVRPSSIPLPVAASRITLSTDLGESQVREQTYNPTISAGSRRVELGHSFGPPLPHANTPQVGQYVSKYTGRTQEEDVVILDKMAHSTTPTGSPLLHRAMFSNQDAASPSLLLATALQPPPTMFAEPSGETTVFRIGKAVENSAADGIDGSQSATQAGMTRSQSSTPLFARSSRALELRRKLFAQSASSRPTTSTPVAVPVLSFSSSITATPTAPTRSHLRRQAQSNYTHEHQENRSRSRGQSRSHPRAGLFSDTDEGETYGDVDDD